MANRKAGNYSFTFTILAFICWIVFTVTTVLDISIIYDWTSIFIGLFSGLAIFSAVEDMGRFKGLGYCFGTGCLVWVLADVIWAFNVHVLGESEIIYKITDNIYLIPDYFFLLALIVYAREIFTKVDYSRIFINTFIFSALAIVFGYRFALDYHEFGNRVTLELVELILYFFVSIFTLIMAAFIISQTGTKHSKSFYLVSIPLAIFSFLEIRYTYYLVINEEPENMYIDIAYMLFLVFYAGGLCRSDMKDVELSIKPLTGKRSNYVYWINGSMLFVLTMVLYIVKYFNSFMVFVMIISIMGYVIMCKTVQTNMLTEELLERQKSENARLEKMVEDKTRELREMNEYLEHISNTDALTGLYNRRYGMDYLAQLVKDGDNYPIALYSLDLNYFKPINDNYGHDMGDVVLKEVGHRLHHLGQDRCTAIRIGGDEFLVIFKNATNDLAINGIGDIICQKMDEPINASVITEENELKSQQFTISASIGVAVIPADTEEIEELYKMADEALYVIKHTHEKSAVLMYRDIENFVSEHKNNETDAAEKSDSEESDITEADVQIEKG